MDEKNLVSDLQAFCKSIPVDFAEARYGVAKLAGEETILDYCITQGPAPQFPNTLLEVFMLTEKCMYDYEIKKGGVLEHCIVLSQLEQISEAHLAEDYFAVHFYAGGHSLVLVEKLKRLDYVRDFVAKVRSQVLKQI